MATVERRKSDWFCLRCKRVLRNTTDLKPQFRDTVTGKLSPGNVVGFTHDQCKRGVIPGKD